MVKALGPLGVAAEHGIEPVMVQIVTRQTGLSWFEGEVLNAPQGKLLRDRAPFWIWTSVRQSCRN